MVIQVVIIGSLFVYKLVATWQCFIIR